MAGAADAEVGAACREEKCKRVALHPAHPWDFYRMPRGEWVPCPACGGEDGAPCSSCSAVRTVPRRRAVEILRELKALGGEGP